MLSEHEFLMLIREALLLLLDAIERKLVCSPRTSELRQRYKQS